MRKKCIIHQKLLHMSRLKLFAFFFVFFEKGKRWSALWKKIWDHISERKGGPVWFPHVSLRPGEWSQRRKSTVKITDYLIGSWRDHYDTPGQKMVRTKQLPSFTVVWTSPVQERKVIHKFNPSQWCFGPITRTCKLGESDKMLAEECGQGKQTHCYLTRVASHWTDQSRAVQPGDISPCLYVNRTPTHLPASLLLPFCNRSEPDNLPYITPPPQH